MSPPLLQIPTLTENLDACLSKLHWAPNGHYVAVGDCEGKVHIFEAGEVCVFMRFSGVSFPLFSPGSIFPCS